MPLSGRGNGPEDHPREHSPTELPATLRVLKALPPHNPGTEPAGEMKVERTLINPENKVGSHLVTLTTHTTNSD
jgi:hypothetical protein